MHKFHVAVLVAIGLATVPISIQLLNAPIASLDSTWLNYQLNLHKSQDAVFGTDPAHDRLTVTSFTQLIANRRRFVSAYDICMGHRVESSRGTHVPCASDKRGPSLKPRSATSFIHQTTDVVESPLAVLCVCVCVERNRSPVKDYHSLRSNPSESFCMVYRSDLLAEITKSWARPSKRE